MKIAMDADCLIKLAKAGLKEAVCASWAVSIPPLVKEETVDRSPHRPDAVRIGENIRAGYLKVHDAGQGYVKGEDAVLSLFNSGGFNAVGTDDTRFIRHLRGLGIPYALPAVILVKLCQEKCMSNQEALDALAALRPYISDDEHAVAYLMLAGGKIP
jgi:rRNA-processing protein FCF1